MIQFDKPLLPPLEAPGTITKELPIEEWLRILKVPIEKFIYHTEVSFKTKKNLIVKAHVLFFLDRICLNYSKQVSRFKDFYYRKVIINNK